MVVVTAWISKVVLSVIDDRVVPIGNVDCSIGTYLSVYWSEVWVF